MKDSPCRNCGERTVSCHGSCKDYKKFNQMCKESRERRYSESLSNYYSEQAIKLTIRRKKGH